MTNVKSFGEFVEKVWNYIQRHVDKVAHYLVTYAIVVTGGLYGLFIVPVALSVVLMVGKEIWDKARGGEFSWSDLFAGFLGLLVAEILVIAARWLAGAV